MSPTTDQPVEAPAAPKATVETIGGYRVHPAARLLPPPNPEDYKRLKADIEENGLLVPITLTPDGRILDGRTRVRICEELELPLEEYDIVKATRAEMEDPVGFVMSRNAARRHLSVDQIAMIYVEAKKAQIKADQQLAQVAQLANLKKGETRPESLTTKPSGKTSAKHAKAAGVSRSAIERAQQIQREVPERVADVVEGKVSATKVLKERKATKSDEHGVAYHDSRGRRRPNRPLPERVDAVMRDTLTAIEFLGWFLIEARQRGHQDFPNWIKEAIDLNAKFSALIDLVQQEPCPSREALRELLDPDLEDEEAAGSSERAS